MGFSLFITLSLLMTSQSFAARQLVLKVVASVTDKTITNRDVQGSYVVDHLLYNEGPYVPLKYGTEEFVGALNRLIIEKIVKEEADTFGVAKVAENEIDETFQKVRGRLKKSSSLRTQWQNLTFSDSQLKDMISRKLKANRFIKYKSNSSFVQVTDEEAKSYFDKNQLKFGTTDFDSFKQDIKKYLGRKNAEDRLRDWLDVLRKKHRVKNLVSGVVVSGHSSGN